MNECPQLNELTLLLTNPGDERAWESLERHLDTCNDCRKRLDALADADSLLVPGSGSWRSQSSSSLALQQMIDKLQASPGKEATVGSPLTANAILAFLQPTEATGFLGRIGIYEIRRVIGQGGMGIVMEALDPILKRTVAIKMLSPWRVLDEDTKARFLREAQSAAALTHENVVGIHAVEEVDGLPFLVLEYVAGESLEGRLRRDGALPFAKVVRLGAELARGLAAAHAKSLIHRDIKPANILLVEDTERAKIADFGLVKTGGEDVLTLTGTLLGTPEFMSPEQAQGKEPDERSDLFSLGAVLYVAATAVSPFRGASLLDTLDNVRGCQPRSLREIDASLPDWFCNLVHRLLAKDPAARIGWASAVAALFEQASTGQSVVDFLADQATVKTATSTRAAPLRSRGQWLLRVGALIGLAAFVAIGGLIWNRKSPDAEPPFAVGPGLAPELPDEPVIPPGFRIVGQDEHFEELAAAILATKDGDLIDVYGNGPFLTQPLKTDGKRLTIRASSGSLPVFLMVQPTATVRQAFLYTDADLRLEGLEIHWAIEEQAKLAEAEMLASSIVACTHGRLMLANCRIVSDRTNCCVSGSCREMILHRCHFVAKDGIGVFWGPEPGGKLKLDGCLLESRLGVSMLVEPGAVGDIPRQARLTRCTLATNHCLQLLFEGIPKQKLQVAAEKTIFDCERFFLLFPHRLPRAKSNQKLDELTGVLRSSVAWSENGNLHSQGIKYISAPTSRSGSLFSADLQSLDRWLDLWQLPPAQSIVADVRFQSRLDSSQSAPLVLESVNNSSGPVPTDLGASPEQVGPGAAYQTWRSSPDYAAWPPAAMQK